MRTLNVNGEYRDCFDVYVDSAVSFLEKQYGPDWIEGFEKDVSGEYLYFPSDYSVFIFGQVEVAIVKLPAEEGRYMLGFQVIKTGNQLDTNQIPKGFVIMNDDDTCPSPITHYLELGEKLVTAEQLTSMTSLSVMYAMAVCVYAAWMAGWKQDVEFRDPTITRQQRRHAERTGKPVDTAKILYIEPWVKQFRTISQASGNSKEMPCFVVRGHRVTYTAQKPNFNCPECRGKGHKDGSKPHVGTIWRDPYFKGKKEHGQIDHTYAVQMPQ